MSGSLSALGYGDRTGMELLDDVERYLRRFVAFPSDAAAVAVALWVAHAHLVDSFESTPRLAVLSPEPGSGKTRVLEAVELLVPRALFTLNASSAALFRKVSDEAGRPTVLIDEADTIFGPRAAKEHEDLRGFVNGGHRRGAMALRCVVKGKTIEVEEYPCYAAVALAGLDDLPDTIMSRSIVIRMRRRAPGERVDPFRRRVDGPPGDELRERLEKWAADAASRVDGAWPEMPDGIEDRNADVWEALLAVADEAGGEWPERARVAAVALVADARRGGESLGVRLLRDVRDAFGQEDKLSTEALLERLTAMDDAPWADLRGKPLDARGLSRRLGKYEVAPKTLRIGDKTPKGYERTDLFDAWARYLPAPPEESATSATTQQRPVWTCAVCGFPIDQALGAVTVHPTCGAA
ncbi:MAG TPA: DUF3631 domain-containing protein [Acidothermaceae bacterium]